MSLTTRNVLDCIEATTIKRTNPADRVCLLYNSAPVASSGYMQRPLAVISQVLNEGADLQVYCTH